MACNNDDVFYDEKNKIRSPNSSKHKQINKQF